jgi:GNAT superfamily N-acetyltransferase
MGQIEAVSTNSARVAEARALFAAYRDFLETIESTHCFDFARYEQEIAGIPAWYSDHGGALLLAFAEGIAAGCIAFRSVDTATCEIKRLFVLPEFRQRGIASLLIGEALRQAKTSGFRKAILDTDVVSMRLLTRPICRLGFGSIFATERMRPRLDFWRWSFEVPPSPYIFVQDLHSNSVMVGSRIEDIHFIQGPDLGGQNACEEALFLR